MAIDDLLRQYSVPFEDRVLTGRAALLLDDSSWMTLHLIEEEDDDLYFEDEDRDEAIYSIYYDIYTPYHINRTVETGAGACFRVRDGQTILDWLDTNDLWPPVAEIDLERLEDGTGLSIYDLESCDYELLFG